VRVGRSLQRRSQKRGADKYDETAAAMIAQLKYGAGTPFYRWSNWRRRWDSLPAATQWRSSRGAQPLKPALDKLIQYAAQGTVVHKTIPACEC